MSVPRRRTIAYRPPLTPRTVRVPHVLQRRGFLSQCDRTNRSPTTGRSRDTEIPRLKRETWGTRLRALKDCLGECRFRAEERSPLVLRSHPEHAGCPTSCKDVGSSVSETKPLAHGQLDAAGTPRSHISNTRRGAPAVIAAAAAVSPAAAGGHPASGLRWGCRPAGPAAAGSGWAGFPARRESALGSSASASHARSPHRRG